MDLRDNEGHTSDSAEDDYCKDYVEAVYYAGVMSLTTERRIGRTCGRSGRWRKGLRPMEGRYTCANDASSARGPQQSRLYLFPISKRVSAPDPPWPARRSPVAVPVSPSPSGQDTSTPSADHLALLPNAHPLGCVASDYLLLPQSYCPSLPRVCSPSTIEAKDEAERCNKRASSCQSATSLASTKQITDLNPHHRTPRASLTKCGGWPINLPTIFCVHTTRPALGSHLLSSAHPSFCMPKPHGPS